MEIPHLGVSIPSALTLCTRYISGPLYLLLSTAGCYSRVLVVFCFPIGPWLIWSQVPEHLSSASDGFHIMEGLITSQMLVG